MFRPGTTSPHPHCDCLAAFGPQPPDPGAHAAAPRGVQVRPEASLLELLRAEGRHGASGGTCDRATPQGWHSDPLAGPETSGRPRLKKHGSLKGSDPLIHFMGFWSQTRVIPSESKVRISWARWRTPIKDSSATVEAFAKSLACSVAWSRSLGLLRDYCGARGFWGATRDCSRSVVGRTGDRRGRRNLLGAAYENPNSARESRRV